MKTLDSILQRAEKEANELLGTGLHVRILVERARPVERGLGANGATSDQLIFNVKQVAEMVGKSDSTIRAWCKSGRLPATKMGRSWIINRAALERLGDMGWLRLENRNSRPSS